MGSRLSPGSTQGTGAKDKTFFKFGRVQLAAMLTHTRNKQPVQVVVLGTNGRQVGKMSGELFGQGCVV